MSGFGSRARARRGAASALAAALLAFLAAAPTPGQEPPESDEEPLETVELEAEDTDEEPAEPEEPVHRPDLERIRFEVPFVDKRGPGVATGSAGSLQYPRPDYVVVEGAVELSYREFRLQAERVEMDLTTKQVLAEGLVILDEGPRRLAGERLDFNLESKTGEMTEGRAFVDPDIYFTGALIAKEGEDVYSVKQGMMTSCADERTPDWSFRMSSGKVRVGGYAQVRNTRMRVKKLPFLYFPYVIWPTERGRKSGLLMPNIGSTKTRGNTLSLAYFQTLGRSYDATLFADIYEEDYLGLGTEFRYTPTGGTRGNITGYAIEDPEVDEVRWKASIWHGSDDLPKGLRAVVRYLEFSDFDFFRDFERDFNEVSIRRINSVGYLTGNWGSHSLNFMIEDNTAFIRRDVFVINRQLPELEYRLRSTQIGGLPLYLQLAGSAHYFSSERTNVYESKWGRADLAPTLTVPLSYWPWLSLSVSAGGRVTHYTDSLDESQSEFTGEALTRTFPSASAEMVGPSFSKIFDWKVGRFGKFKHLIEPRWNYFFVGEFDDQNLVPLFDEIDALRNQHIFAVGLANRLLAKPAAEDSLEGAREIFLFELTQAYSLDDDQPFQVSRDRTMETTRGPIFGRIRFAPGLKINAESRFTFNTLFDRMESASISGAMNLPRYNVGLTWFTRFDPESGDTRTHQARLFSQFDIVRNRLRLAMQINYDLVISLLQQHRYVLNYTSQCWGFIFEFRELNAINRRDRDFRFAISLKNIGTLVDLNAGSREDL